MIEGDTPSKKNSRQLFYKKGRMINIPSQRYKDWHEQALAQVKGYPLLTPPYQIYLTFWMPTNRRTDLDNKVASVLDLLQDAGIIEDDCWQKLELIQATSGGISRDCPRVKVEIHSSI